MCGISGIISKLNYHVPGDEIKRITDLVIHRGPDSEGFFFGKNFAFGHRRLNVIDLSSSGNQPMTYKGRYTITYNGEIYNYLELRNELKKSGYDFVSDSDTEVILAAYDCYGQKCVELFNGMWAFALYDQQKDIIFCSRDRFGVKPFYFTETSDKFIFGSEIKQLLGFHGHLKVNQSILMDFLIADYEDHTNETFFRNIYSLEQSHNLLYDLKEHTFSKYRYYEIKTDNSISQLNELESINMFKELLYDSVNLRLRSDVKVGTCLSGGLDSSAVATIASSLYQSSDGSRFTSVTARSTESESDESYFAGLVSKKSGINWNVVVPGAEDFKYSLDRIVTTLEEPFGGPSAFMQYKVFEKAKETGCIVMLDGQGGDETLLGYERYFPAYLLSLKKKDMFSNFIASSRNSGLSISKLLLYMVYFTNTSVRIRRLRSKFPYINKKYLDLLNTDIFSRSSKSYKNIVDLQKLELEAIQLPHLLKYADRNSMVHSIESRLPYLDYRLVETAVSINNSYKIKDGWTKYLLRKSMEDVLPDEIIWRRNKLGFNAPEASWVEPLTAQIIDQLQRSSILRSITNREYLIKFFNKLDLRTRWRFFNVAKWEEIFNVGLD